MLDTNVILAALLSNRGAAFEILQRLRRGKWRLVLSNHLLLEYEEVLKRNAAAIALTHDEVDRYLNAICQAADCVQLPPAQPPRLPDADDEPLLRLAEASGARSSPRTTSGISAPQRRTVSPSCLHESFCAS